MNRTYIFIALSVIPVITLAALMMQNNSNAADNRKEPFSRPAAQVAAENIAEATSPKKIAKSAPKASGMFPVISTVVTTIANGKSRTVQFPHKFNSKPDQTATYTIHMDYKSGQDAQMRIVPNDCVQLPININGKEIAVSEKVTKNLCNSRKGFKLDMKPFLQEGENKIYITVLNKKGKGGLKFKPARPDKEKS